MKYSKPNASSVTAGGSLLNQESLIWLPCASSASRLRLSAGLMSTVVVIRCSDSAARRSRSGSLGKLGMSSPASRRASQIRRHELPRIVDR